VILTLLGARSLFEAWDLFHFMYAMGDMPAEIAQFVELDAVNLVVILISFSLGFYCLHVFMTGGRKPRSNGGEAE
jgi:hypothetical protein